MSNTAQKHIPELDGLRGIAISLVLFTHFWAFPESTPTINRLATGGWMGVDLFFVLSGFLITGILWDTRHQAGYFKTFYARRSLRIFPLYYLALAIIFFLLPIVSNSADVVEAKADGLWYALYGANILLAMTGWQVLLLDVTWSLSVEEQFYLVWPAVVRWITARSLALTCIALIIAAPIARAVLLYGFETRWEWTYMTTILRADSFAMGALAALSLREGWIRREGLGRVAGCFGLAGAALILALLLSGNFDRKLPMAGSVCYTLIGATATAMLLASLHPGPALRSALLAGPLRHLGRVSYGVYLLHPLSLPVGTTVLERVGLSALTLTPVPALSAALWTGILTLASWAVATVSFRYYETPFLRLKDRFQVHPAPLPPPIRSGAVERLPG